MLIFDKQRKPIEHRWTRYPAGEWHFETERSCDIVIEATGLEPDFWPKLALVTNKFACAGHRVELALPYFPAARGDKETPPDVMAYTMLLGALPLAAIHCFDPHSPVGPTLLRNLGKDVVCHPSTPAVVEAVRGLRIAGVIAPDRGATIRATAVACALDVPLVTAFKVRDPATGRLSNFQTPPLPEQDGRWLVVDDICDGGGTFIGLAKALGLPRERLHLWISHAIFSGNAKALTDHYGWIYTTNSFPSLTDVPCTRLPVHQYMKGLYDVQF